MLDVHSRAEQTAVVGRLIAGAGSLGPYRLLGLLIDVGSIALLMKMLGPGPVGLVAMAEGLLIIVAALSDGGIGSSLIATRTENGGRVAAAFIVGLAAGLLSALICFCLTPLIVGYYRTPAVALPWVCLSIFWSFAVLPSVPQAILQVRGRFDLIGRVQLSSITAGALVAIVTAIFVSGVWALIARRAVTWLFSLVLSTCVASPKLSKPTRGDITGVFGYSAPMIGFNLLNALARNLDNVLIGRFLGESALGLYSLAYRALLIPLSQLTGLINTVALPQLAEMMPERVRIANALSELIGTLLRCTSVGLVTLACVAPIVIPWALGPSWVDAAVPSQVLILLAVYQTPFALSGMAFTATSQTQRLFVWALLSTPVIILSFLVGIRWGIVGVSCAYAATSLLLAPALVAAMARTLGVSVRQFIRPIASAAKVSMQHGLAPVAAYLFTTWLAVGDIFVVAVTLLVGTITSVKSIHATGLTGRKKT